jgi:signal transduction histidine kinase/ActR/RegA family two-component response regulator
MKVLVYSPDAGERQDLVDRLEEAGHEAEATPTPPVGAAGEDALAVVLPTTIEEGEVLLREQRKLAGDEVILLGLGSWRDPKKIEALLEAGADDYTHYPCETKQLAVRLTVLQRQRERHSVNAEQRRLLERVQQTQKVETLRTLTGSIAHDFNNLLAAIVGNTELALLDSSIQPPVRYSLDQIDKAARRASDLARQMLVYTGKSALEFKSVNLSELVEELTDLLRVSISRRCTIKYHLMRPLPPVRGEAGQLRQVVMNLIANAAEAMGHEGGVIRVKTLAVHSGGSTLVGIEVTDTGRGVDADTKTRMFDPFYTTKSSGRGLGLAAVQGIVDTHRGRIEVESEPGRGATFRVLLPALTQDHPASTYGLESEWRGEGKLLLVDDEEAVREAAQRLLKRAGFTVLEAGSGDEGLALFEANANDLRAVILDLSMPGMDGTELLQVIRERSPRMKVIVWSGHEERDVRASLERFQPVSFVEKPAHVRELAAELKRALEQA